ncbi:hypothetical protein BDV38DRAFT_266976 [Aspergillus pseudotamarii]|uniref:D-isomer specific 2-hydroxyacid dehydrogenase NAD-binding domain-containing protein n=1 Tax=Aspergillus pseudotamarii TaxID=132259 RepID=A0A5N6TBZ4_ASPPS|nr:uncharacterized protein BDV38DRAFT_266976 [Aspergillus pseudotamarii]KAE8143853.1 hypothetical protein BDV38DRAFT_266976 [Aspergillus pseudotamarii]
MTPSFLPLNSGPPVSKLCKDVLLIQMPIEIPAEWKRKMESKYPGIEIRSRVLWLELGLEANQIEPELWNGVTLTCLYLTHPEELMSNVRFIQLTSAGVDRWIHHQRYNSPDVAFSTASGIHCPQIAEWVMSTWIMRNHNILRHIESQREGTWSVVRAETRDSAGMRMGILGYGFVGRQYARLATAMGMEVYAFTRTPYTSDKKAKSDHYSVLGMGDPHGQLPSKWFHGESRDAVNEFLRQDLDLLVLCLPLTKETEYLLGPEQFAILAQGNKRIFISNVARGRLICTEALIDALHKGKIWGAAVDVTDPEPLPESHPLFSAPNVVITHHVSWQSSNNWDRMLDILEANLDRLDKGENLINIPDRKLG